MERQPHQRGVVLKYSESSLYSEQRPTSSLSHIDLVSSSSRDLQTKNGGRDRTGVVGRFVPVPFELLNGSLPTICCCFIPSYANTN